MTGRIIAPLLLLAAIAKPAGAQTAREYADFGYRFTAPAAFAVSQEGIAVSVVNDAAVERVVITPFAVTDRDRPRTERVHAFLELQDYEVLGVEQVRGDGSVVVVGEATDGSTLVVVREVWVDGDGGVRIVGEMDPLEPDAVLGIMNSIEVTDPSALMRAGRLAGQID